jgi:hypothetical protein
MFIGKTTSELPSFRSPDSNAIERTHPTAPLGMVSDRANPLRAMKSSASCAK